MAGNEMVDVITRECDNCSISSNLQNNITPPSPSIFKKRIYSQSGMDDEQNTFQAKKLRIDRTFENNDGPKMLPELLINHIIPYVARDWLCVSKEWSKVAYEKLNFDPRVNLNWRSLERAICCNSVPGVSKHINPTTLKEHSISVWYILDVAIENESAVIAKFILDDPRMADCNTLSEKLWKAVRWNRPVMVALLLQHPQIDPIQCGARAVSLATSLGREVVLKTLRRDERVRQAEADSSLTSPWAMPPQPALWTRSTLFNATHNSNSRPLAPQYIPLPALRSTSRIAIPIQSNMTRAVARSKPQRPIALDLANLTHLGPSANSLNYPSNNMSEEFLLAVVANKEEDVKVILKDKFESIPLDVLHDAANIAISDMHFTLTNLIQQAINRRTKTEVSEPKEL